MDQDLKVRGKTIKLFKRKHKYNLCNLDFGSYIGHLNHKQQKERWRNWTS